MLTVILLAGFKNISNSIALRTEAWQMQKKPGSLRIMTWNVEAFLDFYPRSDPRSQPRIGIYEAIQRYKPDVICFQEYDNVKGPGYISVEKEINEMGYKYSFISNDSVNIIYHSPDTAYSGSAIFSLMPLLDTERINIRSSDRNENVVQGDILFDNRKLRVFTGHLASLNLYIDTLLEPPTTDNIYQITYNRKRKIAYRFSAGEKKHEKEVAIIRRHIEQSPYPAIYCGDNNTTPTSYSYNFLKDGMQDAFIEKGSGIGRTFFELSPTLRIDVCLVDKAFKVLQCTTPQLHFSDHYPIIIDIEWRKE